MNRIHTQLVAAFALGALVITSCAAKNAATPVPTVAPPPRAQAAVAPAAAAPTPDAAAPAPAPASGTPVASQVTMPDDVQEQLDGYVLHFAFDDASLSDASRKELEAMATVLRTHPAVHIRIEGNCDERGTEEYNLALGQRRADAARKYLAALGIAADRIDTITFGFNHPVDGAHNEQAWAKNRRDDVRVSGGAAKTAGV